MNGTAGSLTGMYSCINICHFSVWERYYSRSPISVRPENMIYMYKAKAHRFDSGVLLLCTYITEVTGDLT